MTAVTDRIGRAGLGAIAITLAAAIMALFYLGIWRELTRETGRTVTAVFPSSAQLQEGDPVRLDGADEGRVEKIRNLPGGRGALVEMDVLDGAGPIYSDAKADLRWRLLLGGSFYIEIDRGTPGRPLLGDRRIEGDRATTQVELDDLSRVFSPDARRGLSTLPGELAHSLEDPEIPARALDTLADVSPDLEGGLNALRGRTPDRDLRRLVTGVAATVRALESPSDELRTLVSGAASTLRTTAGRGDDLRSSIRQMPGTLDAVERTLTRLEPTLTGADGLIDRVLVAAPKLAPSLAALRPALIETDGVLRRARPLLTALRPAVTSLARTADDGVPAIDELEPSLVRLDEQIIPDIAKKDPATGKSTTVMLGGFAAGFGGISGQQDANGHFIRFPATAMDRSIHLPCRFGLTDPSVGKALACDSLEQALQTYFNYLPGTPGQEGEGTP